MRPHLDGIGPILSFLPWLSSKAFGLPSGWWIVSYPRPISHNETLLATCYSVAIPMADVPASYVPWFHHFRHSQLGYAMLLTLSRFILISFIFHWWGESSTQTASLHELLHFRKDFQQDPSMITTILASTSRMSTVIYPTSPNNKHVCSPLLYAFTKS